MNRWWNECLQGGLQQVHRPIRLGVVVVVSNCRHPVFRCWAILKLMITCIWNCWDCLHNGAVVFIKSWMRYFYHDEIRSASSCKFSMWWSYWKERIPWAPLTVLSTHRGNTVTNSAIWDHSFMAVNLIHDEANAYPKFFLFSKICKLLATHKNPLKVHQSSLLCQ